MDVQKGQPGKKIIMSFRDKNVFETVSAAKVDEVYDVTLEKGEKYWEWVAINRAGTSSPVKQDTVGKASPKSTYETPEERAKRQILIVRQSSLSSAVAALGAGPKSAVDPDAVMDLAKRFENYVFGEDEPETDIQDNKEFSDAPF